MAILTALVGFLGRFAGKVLTTTLGWASVLLFGRIPEQRQSRFAVLTFGSLVWLATVAGIVLPEAGTLLIGFLPLPEWVDRGLVRLAMLAAALVLPIILGAVAASIADAPDPPAASGDGPGGARLAAVVRGYLIAPVLAISLAVLAVTGVVRKLRAVVARRVTGHVAIVVRPGRYAALVDQVEQILRPAGLVDRRTSGSRALTATARALAKVSGTGLGRLVPERLVVLVGPEVEVQVYPSDLSIAGTRSGLARARAAILRELDSQHCWFTTQPAAQEIEDALAQVDGAPGAWDPAAIRAVDQHLATDALDDEEWDILFRRRLQVAAEATGTNLRAGALDGDPGPNQTGGPNLAGEPNLAGGTTARGTGAAIATLLGLVMAGLVLADIALLATRRLDQTQARSGRRG